MSFSCGREGKFRGDSPVHMKAFSQKDTLKVTLGRARERKKELQQRGALGNQRSIACRREMRALNKNTKTCSRSDWTTCSWIQGCHSFRRSPGLSYKRGLGGWLHWRGEPYPTEPSLHNLLVASFLLALCWPLIGPLGPSWWAWRGL